MLQPYSQTEQAARDTYLHKAESWAFDTLAELVGLPYNAGFSRAAWRDLLLAAAYGYRGTWTTFFAGLRALYEPQGEAVTVTRDPAAPQTLTYVSGLAAGGWECSHANRLIVVEGAVYWSTGPQIGGGTSATLTLDAQATSYWQAADWSGLPAADQVVATVLPFLPVEHTPGPILDNAGDQLDALTSGAGVGARIRLLLSQGFASPGSYLIDPAGAAKPAGQPYGAHMMDLFDPNTPEAGDQTNGPFPLYLASADSVESLRKILRPLLVAGVDVEPELVEFCA